MEKSLGPGTIGLTAEVTHHQRGLVWGSALFGNHLT